MPILGLGLHIIVAIFFAIHAIRSGQDRYWLFVLFAFPLIGSIVYGFAIWLPEQRNTRHGRAVVRGVRNAIDPNRELRSAQHALDENSSPANRLRLADAMLAAGRASEAVVHYDEALAGVHADAPDIQVRLAKALLESGQAEKARDVLDRLIHQNPDYRSPEGHLIYARAIAATGDRQKAREEFDALIHGFAGLEARAHYASTLASWSENEAAVQLCRQSLALADRMPKHARRLNDVWIRQLQQTLRSIDPSN